MTLPRKPSDRRRPAGTSTAHGRKPCEVKPPEIYIAVRESVFPGLKYAKARIRIRKGCYQYLTWRDGADTREFYLGKKEIRTPHRGSDRGAAGLAGAGAGRAAVRGKK